MSNKSLYKDLCDTEGSRIPLFLQHWWMEAVCAGKQWDVLLAYDKQGTISGALPYLIGSKLGLRYVVQPQLTQFNGPWFRYPSDSLSHRERLNFEESVMNQLLEGLKQLRLFFYQQNCAPEITNWLPYHWKGYRQTTRYSYRINDISNLDAVYAAFRKRDRQAAIRRLQPCVHRIDTLSATDFAHLHHRYWQSKGSKDLLPLDFIERVCNAAIVRQQGLLLGLADANNVLLGATFAAFDDRCAFSLLGAMNPDVDTRDVSENLMWELLKELTHRTQAFDFEGSMDPHIEYFYRSFGAVQTPYFRIYKWMI